MTSIERNSSFAHILLNRVNRDMVFNVGGTPIRKNIHSILTPRFLLGVIPESQRKFVGAKLLLRSNKILFQSIKQIVEYAICFATRIVVVKMKVYSPESPVLLNIPSYTINIQVMRIIKYSTDIYIMSSTCYKTTHHGSIIMKLIG